MLEVRDEGEYLQQLPEGFIFHHHQHPGCFVRRQVVVLDERKYHKSLALVGSWTPENLPHYNERGQLCMCFHARQIFSGNLGSHQYPSSTFESVQFDNSKNYNSIDPTKLEPLSLVVPEMTQDQIDAAYWWQIVGEVVRCMKTADAPKIDPANMLSNVFEILKKVPELDTRLKYAGREAEHLQSIKNNLATTGQWELHDYQDFYARDLEFLIPLAEAHLTTLG